MIDPIVAHKLQVIVGIVASMATLIFVVVAALSIFPELQAWNRKNIGSYFEIFLDPPRELIEQRDSKGLYAKARAGQSRNVVGVDIPFDPPPNADLVVRPPQIFEPPAQIAALIYGRLLLTGRHEQ